MYSSQGCVLQEVKVDISSCNKKHDHVVTSSFPQLKEGRKGGRRGGRDKRKRKGREGERRGGEGREGKGEKRKNTVVTTKVWIISNSYS
jgi:hypothetical protein